MLQPLTRSRTENQHFVSVLVASKKQFRALREVTIEGALAEAERQAIERKDRGDVYSPSTSRGSSMDSMRRPAPAQPPSLAEVPEDNQFAIGDDDEDDEAAGLDEKHVGDSAHDSSAESTVQAETTSPTRLSAKARGKQRAALQISTSRNTSTTSLPTLTLSTSTQTFKPSEQWLESWYSHLPLDQILKVIDDRESQKQGVSARTSISDTRADASVDRPSTARKEPGVDTREARQPSPLARQSVESARSSQPAYGADGQGHLGLKGKHSIAPITTSANAPKSDNIRPAAGGPVNFQWTAVAVGWYNALIWSRIYLQEAEAFQGSGGLYSSTDIKLFRRQGASQEISLRSPKGAIDAVGASLAQRISSISLPDALGGASTAAK